MATIIAQWSGGSTTMTIPESQAVNPEGTPAIDGTNRFGTPNSCYTITNANAQYFNIGATPTFASKTAIFWIKPASFPAASNSLVYTGADLLKVSNGGTVSSSMSSPTIYVNGVTGNSISTGSWVMLAATSATASSGRMYINNGAGYGITGLMGELTVYSDTLSESEIYNIYTGVISTLESGVSFGSANMMTCGM